MRLAQLAVLANRRRVSEQLGRPSQRGHRSRPSVVVSGAILLDQREALGQVAGHLMLRSIWQGADRSPDDGRRRVGELAARIQRRELAASRVQGGLV